MLCLNHALLLLASLAECLATKTTGRVGPAAKQMHLPWLRCCIRTFVPVCNMNRTEQRFDAGRLSWSTNSHMIFTAAVLRRGLGGYASTELQAPSAEALATSTAVQDSLLREPRPSGVGVAQSVFLPHFHPWVCRGMSSGRCTVVCSLQNLSTSKSCSSDLTNYFAVIWCLHVDAIERLAELVHRCDHAVGFKFTCVCKALQQRRLQLG